LVDAKCVMPRCDVDESTSARSAWVNWPRNQDIYVHTDVQVCKHLLWGTCTLPRAGKNVHDACMAIYPICLRRSWIGKLKTCQEDTTRQTRKTTANTSWSIYNYADAWPAGNWQGSVREAGSRDEQKVGKTTKKNGGGDQEVKGCPPMA
jgi:hypothetical protein